MDFIKCFCLPKQTVTWNQLSNISPSSAEYPCHFTFLWKIQDLFISCLRCKHHSSCQDGPVVRFLRFDPMVSGSNPQEAKLSQSEESRKLSAIPGLGITRRGHIESKDLDTAR